MNTTVDTAARFLVAARRARRPGERMPEALRPADAETAVAIQQRVTELLGLAVGGWKCSVPTPPRPIPMAPIYASTITSAMPCPILPIAGKARIEPEIAFEMARDLTSRDAPYSEAEVRAAIRTPRLVLELMGPRYIDPTAATFPELLADGIANQGLFVGPAIECALDFALDSFPIIIEADGTALHSVQGKHPDGHPLKPLVWLANYLSKRSDGLRAGQVVTTGSYCGVVDLPLHTLLTVRFGEIASLSVEFSA
ncbi:MAG TPA: 2-keto-4-pentenoate hydratase [Casimicrobiaceae bacterium]